MKDSTWSLVNSISNKNKEEFDKYVETSDVNDTGVTRLDTCTVIVTPLYRAIRTDENNLYFTEQLLKRGANVNYIHWKDTLNQQTYVDVAFCYFPRDETLHGLLRLFIQYGLTYETLTKTKKHNLGYSTFTERAYDGMVRYLKLFPFLVMDVPDSLRYVLYSLL